MTSNTSAERSETFTWMDPAIALQQLPRLSGMDYFSGLRKGSIAPPPIGYTSIDLSVKYLRPVTLRKGALRAEGAVVKAGSRLIFTEGRLCTTEGELLATATSTLLVFAHQPETLAP